MTLRGLGLLLSGAVLAALGWALGWPELTALGAAALALVLLCLPATVATPVVRVAVEGASLHVTRGEPAKARVTVTADRRRPRMRLVVGPLNDPQASLGVRAGRDDVVVPVPVDTSRRGEHVVGPFTVVRGDPWSVVRSVAGADKGGLVVVRPKTWPVRPGFAKAQRAGDNDASSRQRGDDHFFALRDYVLGDESRSVHWRSSARSGRLVVKQRVAAASEGTLIVLDVDASAYSSGAAFGAGFVEERFEAAVEVAASLCAARSKGVERVQLATTVRGTSILTAAASGSPQTLLDALALVRSLPPVETAPEELASVVRRTRCTTVLVVSGTPGRALLASAAGCSSLASTTVVRVAPTEPAGGRVVDVAGPEDLA